MLAVHPRLLGLFAPVLLATVLWGNETKWTAPVDGLFFDPAAWTDGSPTDTSTVIIDATGGTPYTVSFGEGEEGFGVDSLLLDSPDVTFAIGQLAGADIDDAFEVRQGTLNITNNPFFDLTFGSFFNAGTFVIDDSEVYFSGLFVTNQTAGQITVEGAGYWVVESVIFRNEGELTLQDGGYLDVFGAEQIVNEVGGVIKSIDAGGASFYSGSLRNAGQIQVEGGVVDFEGDSFENSGEITNDGGYLAFSTESSWENSGTFQHLSGFSSIFVEDSVSNYGSFVVDGSSSGDPGDLTLVETDTISNTGSFVSSGGLLGLLADSYFFNGEGATVAARDDGLVGLSAWEIFNSGTFESTGSGVFVIFGDLFNTSSGVITGDSIFAFESSANIFDGTLSPGPGIATLELQAAEVSFAGAMTLDIELGGTSADRVLVAGANFEGDDFESIPFVGVWDIGTDVLHLQLTLTDAPQPQAFTILEVYGDEGVIVGQLADLPQGSTVIGTFGGIDYPFTVDYAPDGRSVSLVFVPEPRLFAFASALVALGWALCRRR